MARVDVKPNVSVADRIILHLWENDHQADHYIVSSDVTRPGIARSCALHPPNVSRTMSNLMTKGTVSQHSRTIRGENRRQKTWQLTDSGRELAGDRISEIRSTKVLVRSSEGELLEVRADQVALKLQADLTLLQVLMHAQHEGVLNFGDIRFGALVSNEADKPPPGSLSLLTGAHSTYHTSPPRTREVHGRSKEKAILEGWFQTGKPMFVLSGIAGCGKTTLASHWLSELRNSNSTIRVMYYPCQPWDSPLGIATSILHRLGITEDSEDPYNILEALPFMPAARLDIDSYRRRLTAHMLDKENGLDLETKKRSDEIIIILDDVHNIGSQGDHLFGALLQVAEVTKIRLILISRTSLSFYDRRDVITRNRIEELSLKGLNLAEISDWLKGIDLAEDSEIEQVFEATGGHPLALELLEIYGKATHEDWLRFLDEEILDVLPEDHREILSILAVSDRPVPWTKLAKISNIDGKPPIPLIERGLMIELEEGMWLHEALKSRLLREVGAPHEERLRKLHDLD